MKVIKNIGIYTCVAVLVIWSLFPFFQMVSASLAGARLPDELGLPDTLTVDNFKKVLFQESPPILFFLGNSIIFALLASVASLVISLPAAYSFSRSNSRGLGVLFYVFLIFRMIPWITLSLPIFFLMSKLGLIGGKGLSLVYTFLFTSFGVWLMKGFFDMIAPELEESALVDGASRFQAFIKIILPLSVPGMVVTGAFVFLFSYIEYMYALILSTQNSVTISVRLAGYATEGRYFYREMTASALISVIPMILLFSYLQKHLTRGLSWGAFK